MGQAPTTKSRSRKTTQKGEKRKAEDIFKRDGISEDEKEETEEILSAKQDKDPLKDVFDHIEKTGKPWPHGIDGHTEFSVHHKTPKGQVIQTLTYTSVVLLTAIMLFGMITHDREVLFAVLEVVKYYGFSLALWALGSVVTSLLPPRRSTREDGAKEEKSG